MNKKRGWGIKRNLALIIMTISLQSCVAVALPLLTAATVASVAASGFFVFKTVQTSTGGNVRISFSEEDVPLETKVLLSKITNPSVWPGNEAEVYLADTLETSQEFESVITPSAVTRMLSTLAIDQNTSLMTESERLRIFRQICDEANADAVIATRDIGAETNTNIFSLQRANITQRALITLYSYEADRIILTTEIQLVTELGSSTQNDQEVLRIAGQAIAEKVIQIRKG